MNVSNIKDNDISLYLYNTEIGSEIKHIDKLFTKGLKNAIWFNPLTEKDKIIQYIKKIRGLILFTIFVSCHMFNYTNINIIPTN